jgi:methylated-DNA-[protein]-cysteine S-methyltransferase
MSIRYAMVDSPIGALRVAVCDGTLYQIDFPDGPQAKHEPEPGWLHEPFAVSEVADQLGEYFAGDRQRFEIPLASRGTPFQQAVWQALLAIPYGHTTTYGDIARRIQRPRAVRAVGAANGANPIPIVVPCHRVIGSNGTLTGFGGGLPVKRFLLELERGSRGLFA